MKLKTSCLFIGAFFVGFSAVQVAAEIQGRVEVIASLPDWQGIWQLTGSVHELSGDANNPPPFKSDWVEKKAEPDELDTAERYCAIGLPGLIGSGEPFEMIVTPEETLMYFASREIRHLWTDDRDQPPKDERWPLFWGDSKGYWDDQTLIMETIDMRGDLWIDASGAKLSEQAQMIEHFSQPDDNHLQVQVTITDPVAFTRPWTFTRVYQRLPDRYLQENVCEWTAGQAAK